MIGDENPYGDGHAAERIVEAIFAWDRARKFPEVTAIARTA
jgi:UDP-N-acetylglucosamine 2-epimerase